ncbi:MAG TPA: phosphotransferase [Solirubrobacteraceae bacterium]
MTIADRPEELTPEWFTAVLGRPVAAVDAAPIGTGQVGLVLRAELTYDGDASPPAPSSLVVKIPSPDPGSRQMATAMGLYEGEVRFYSEIAPRLGPAVPAMHWAAFEDGGRFTLVLDDLSDGSVVGDMVAGCGADEATLAIGALARFQAPVWDDPGLPSRPWLGHAKTDLLFGAVAPSVPVFVERFADRLAPEHIALVERLAPKAAGYRECVWRPPYVIAHSDYRLDNMLFGNGDGAPPISVVDWQGARLGPPLLDAAVFLASCVSTEQRRALEHDLLRAYHADLRAARITGFSFDDCLDSYGRCSLWPFLLGVAVSVSVVQTERGDAMWTRLMSGAAQLVLDTGADRLLD